MLKLSTTRVYLKTFDQFGVYQDWQEISSDVNLESMGQLSYRIESNAYDVGVFRSTETTITLRNEDGFYSSPGSAQTIFDYSRNKSLVKITWEIENEDAPLCGVAICGQEYLSDTVTIFIGVLTDEATSDSVERNDVSFKLLSLDSVLERVEAPYAAIVASDKKISTIIGLCLNQTEITDVLTIGAITLDADYALNVITDFENKTVFEVLSTCLVLGNSVAKVTLDDLTIQPRTPSATLLHTFYGQSSNNGLENIISISDIKNGLSRTFNLVTWRDTSLVKRSTTSIDLYGVRKKELSYEQVTNDVNRQVSIDAIFDEFQTPKRELSIETFLDYETADLSLLDRVNIDYPTVSYPAEGGILPLYGFAKYGEVEYPFSEWSLTLLSSTEWKILTKKINVRQQTIEFLLREI